MAELSGTAKLANGDPATRIVAVHPLRGHVRTVAPALDGSYAIPGVPKGQWLVTAEGPAGYRPLTHVLDVERVPEAETLYAKVWEAWSFDTSRAGEKNASVLVGSNEGNLVEGRAPPGKALRITSVGPHSYEPGSGVTNATGYSLWFKIRDAGAFDVRFPFVSNGTGSSDTQFGYLWGVQGNYNGTRYFSIQGRLHSTATPLTYYTEIPSFDAGIWHHLVAVVSTEGLSIWIDGQKSQVAGSGLPINGSVRNLNFVFPGLDIDDVLQLEAVPTDEEIAYLWAAGSGRTWGDISADAGY